MIKIFFALLLVVAVAYTAGIAVAVTTNDTLSQDSHPDTLLGTNRTNGTAIVVPFNQTTLTNNLQGIPKYLTPNAATGESVALPFTEKSVPASKNKTKKEKGPLDTKDVIIYWAPVYIIIIMLILVCVSYTRQQAPRVHQSPPVGVNGRKRRRTAAGTAPVVACSYPTRDNANQVIDNNVLYLYFMNALTNPARIWDRFVSPYILPMYHFFKKKTVTPGILPPPAPPSSPIPDIVPNDCGGNVNHSYTSVDDITAVNLNTIRDLPSACVNICSGSRSISPNSEEPRVDIISRMEKGEVMYRTCGDGAELNNNKPGTSNMHPFDPELPSTSYHVHADVSQKQNDNKKTCENSNPAPTILAVNNGEQRRRRDISNLRVTFKCGKAFLKVHRYD